MIALIDAEKGMTVGQMVAYNFRAAEVFKKHGIDFCCKGHRLLKDVCTEKNLDMKAIIHELADKIAASIPRSEDAMSAMPLNELAAHIESVHHTYVRESIPVLLGFMEKVNRVHGKRHPELNEIFMLIVDCAEDLTQHMIKEETILFPAIKRLADAERNGKIITQPFFFGSLSSPVNSMKEEHAVEGARFLRIAELCNNFNPPEDACTTYKVAYMKLNEFMNDLFTHVHLENNILFPRAIKLEEKVVVLPDHGHNV